jgi:hypothetical protein
MPRKIRQLEANLGGEDFRVLPGRGKGDHSVWGHPLAPANQVTLDGQPGDDAKHYQERQVRAAIAAVRAARAAQAERKDQ